MPAISNLDHYIQICSRKFFCFCLLLSCALLPLASRADLLSATLAYHQGDYTSAKKEFLQLAHLGNADAIYNIAVMYLHGQGTEKNTAKAYAWFSLAADFGLLEARDTAHLIAQQSKQQQALNDAYQALLSQLSYRQYEQQLKPQLNLQTQQLDQPTRNYTVEPKYPEHAYQNGIEGWVWLEFDIDASGAVTDISLIDAYPKKTFDRALINAVKRWQYEGDEQLPYYSRSLLYHFTTYKGEQYQQSFQSQQQAYGDKIADLIDAAEQGNALVQYYIANWLSSDQYNASKLLKYHWQQPSASSEILLASAKNGYANSQYRLGANLLRGQYSLIDRKKGLNWVLLAAQSGFANAQYRLGRELLDKQQLEYAPNKAFKWLSTAAEQGHFRAKRDLIALMLELDKPDAKIREVLNSAFEIDNTHPQLLLYESQLYAKGQQKTKAIAVAKNALAQANNRGWDQQAITAHLAQLQ